MPETKKKAKAPKPVTPSARKAAQRKKGAPAEAAPKTSTARAAVKKAAAKQAAAKQAAPARTRAARATAKAAPARPAAAKGTGKAAAATSTRKAAPAKAAAAAAPKKAGRTRPTPKAPARARARRPASAPAPAPAPAPAAPGRAAPASVDPEGFFVARVRGEDAVRDAPHPMLEGGSFDEEPAPQAGFDEGLGELPWSYGEDVLIALPRDPRTLFLYWDHAHATLSGAFQGLDQPRAQIWLYVRGAGWERIRVVDFALESRGYYLHDLEPGRVYRAEIHVVDRHGGERLLPHTSNPMMLPPVGPSPVVDDRFVSIPWALPLPRLLGQGVPGGPFSEELRALLARLSDWSRYLDAQAGQAAEGARGTGARPTSRGGGGAGGAPPSSPSSPGGPFRAGGR